jgi:hypothetical protein
MSIKNSWYAVKSDFKDLCYDIWGLLGDLICTGLDIALPKYVGYKLLLYKTKRHMWTKEYLQNWDETIQYLVDNKDFKPKWKDKIMKVAKYNSNLGYQKYAWCMKCDKRNTKECNKKVCYKNIDGDKPKLFRSDEPIQ